MKRILKIVVVVGLLITLFALLRIYSMRNVATSSHTAVDDTNQQMVQLLRKVEAFYHHPQEKSFLRNTAITDGELVAIKDEVRAINVASSEKNKVLTEVAIVEWKQQAQQAVNELYNQSSRAVIEGDRILTERILAKDLTLASVEALEKQYVVETPKRDNAVIADAFTEAITQLLSEAKIQVEAYTKAKEILSKVQAIVIEDGQIGNIAKTLRDFEEQLKLITDAKMKEELSTQADSYVNRFLIALKGIAEEIPGYYDLAVVAVEPSTLLTNLLKTQRAQFGQTEVVTEQLVEENLYYIQETPVSMSEVVAVTEMSAIIEEPIVTDVEVPVAPEGNVE